MKISELIDHMTHVKEEYGDCTVFILYKSVLEGAIIQDAKDMALSRLPTSKDSSETVFMISNCPIVANREGTREEVEMMLKSNTSCKKKNTEVSSKQETRLFIGIEDVVSSFFAETEKYYVDHDEIQDFHDFVFHKVKCDSNYDSVTIDLDLSAFERFAEIRRDIVQLDNGRLYRKIPACRFDNKVGNPMIREFVREFLKLKEDETTC